VLKAAEGRKGEGWQFVDFSLRAALGTKLPGDEPAQPGKARTSANRRQQ